MKRKLAAIVLGAGMGALAAMNVGDKNQDYMHGLCDFTIDGRTVRAVGESCEDIYQNTIQEVIDNRGFYCEQENALYTRRCSSVEGLTYKGRNQK